MSFLAIMLSTSILRIVCPIGVEGTLFLSQILSMFLEEVTRMMCSYDSSVMSPDMVLSSTRVFKLSFL